MIVAVDIIVLFELKNTAVKMPLSKPDFDPSLLYTMTNPLYIQANVNDCMLLELATVQLYLTSCSGQAGPLAGKIGWMVITRSAKEQAKLMLHSLVTIAKLPVAQKQLVSPKSSKETTVILFSVPETCMQQVDTATCTS